MVGHGLDLSASGYGLTAGCCKNSIEPSGSVTWRTARLMDELQTFTCQEGLWSVELVIYSISLLVR